MLTLLHTAAMRNDLQSDPLIFLALLHTAEGLRAGQQPAGRGRGQWTAATATKGEFIVKGEFVR